MLPERGTEDDKERLITLTHEWTTFGEVDD